ncbi:MAG: fibronectin type III domain-containing protein [Bacteroidales bacterium]|nr:fibronectin type III domain-containing protein [Bacteroidales bacterium]
MKRFNYVLFLTLIVNQVFAGTRFYRASFRDDPTTTIVIGWCEDGTSTNPKLFYGPQDHGQNYQNYPYQATVSRTVSHRGLVNHFVRLTNLQPGTKYFFVIKDDQSISPRMSFKTLSDNPNVPILFVSGGDTRTGVPLVEYEVDQCVPRRKRGFELVAKIRPDFVAFSGDFVLTNTSTQQWIDWFTDFQLTIGPEGRLTPIIPVFGNHEDAVDVYNFFDIPNSNAFYALTFGGNLLRLYTLNSDIGCGSSQLNWFQNDLQLHTNTVNEPYWKAVQYHIPLVPHGEYSPMTSLISCWAPLFTQYQVRLAMEGHTHVVKITWPIVPSNATGSDNGFIRNDQNGTVYLGEGSWGAPLRNLYTYYSSSAAYNWTRNQGKFASFFVVTVTKQKIQIRTVMFNDASQVANVSQVQPNDPPGTLPSGLTFWNPSNGGLVEIPTNRILSNDATLSQLQVSYGNLSPNFNSSVTTYEVLVPDTLSFVPIVTATPSHPGAYVSIQQATSIQGTQSNRTATITVTAEDGVTTKIYQVVFQAMPIANAYLQSLVPSHGSLTPSFSPTTYNYIVYLPYGFVDTPYVTATPQDPMATMTITQPTSPDGIATVVVTSSNQQVTKTYTVDFIVSSSTDNYIISFVVPNQIGQSIIDNQNNTIQFTMPYNYDVTAIVPYIVHTGVSIHPPAGTPRNFTTPVQYTVYSANNTPRTYTVYCSFAQPSSDAYLSYLEVKDKILDPSFTPENSLYFVYDTASKPVIIAIPRDLNATVKIFPPESATGSSAQRTAQILVIAPDLITTRLYSIIFGTQTSIPSQFLPTIRVFPNPCTSAFYIQLPDQQQTYQIQIFSGLGHLMYDNIVTSKEIRVDCANWPAGTYFVIVKYYHANVHFKKVKVIIQK